MVDDWRRSPQEIDPLSWFTGQMLPIVFGIASLVQGVPAIIVSWDRWSSAGLQVLAVVVFASASVVAAVAVRSPRGRLGHGHVALMLVLGSVGIAASAGGLVGGSVRPENWWAPLSFAIILGTLSPYCSLRDLLVYAVPSVIVVGSAAVIVYRNTDTYWPLGTVVIICLAAVITATAGGGVFSYTIVSRTRRLIAEYEQRERSADGQRGSAASTHPIATHGPSQQTAVAQSTVIAQVSARVVPFLRGLAESGVITDADRTLAGELARSLRTDLVRVTDSSWLDTLAQSSGFIVNDPQRLADRMNEAQRSTLRALVLAELDSPDVDSGSLLIELRAQADGSIAVALSLDVDLPEGRRLMFLAPYYLTLGTTVDDLSWDPEAGVRLRFQIPPEPRA